MGRILLHQLPSELGCGDCHHKLRHGGFEHLNLHYKLVVRRRHQLGKGEQQILPLLEVQSGTQAVAEPPS